MKLRHPNSAKSYFQAIKVLGMLPKKQHAHYKVLVKRGNRRSGYYEPPFRFRDKSGMFDCFRVARDTTAIPDHPLLVVSAVA